ncbi:MAG: thioesterase family protein [Caldilineaceae bacterium]
MHSTEIPIPDAPVALKTDVRFAETDQMGVVHHSSYIVWFEMGRVAWMKAAGMPYTEVAESGHNFAVTAIHAAYRASCRFGDTIQIVTRLAKLRSRQVEFVYEVRNTVAPSLLATGSSEHICVDDAGKMTKIPANIYERLLQGAVSLAQRQTPADLVGR